ncbi:hypothetical protein ACMFMF_011779 [Clarireedia jacksonii]
MSQLLAGYHYSSLSAYLNSKMLFSSNFKNTTRRKIFAFATSALVVLALFRAHKINVIEAAPKDLLYTARPDGYQYPLIHSKALIVASIMQDDVSWLNDKQLSDWSKSIYIVDSLQGNLTVPKNKGREAMVYLTYIIDNYEKLPDIMVFSHSKQYQWHNDSPSYDGLQVLKRLQVPYLLREGYVNLRCSWIVGCTKPLRPAQQSANFYERQYAIAFGHLFPAKAVPSTVMAPCCSQFGLSRWKTLERPKEDYENYRQWLLETDLSDYYSGRIMEYVWHMIFGKPPQSCQNEELCYCELFGLCEAAVSGKTYVLPPVGTYDRPLSFDG